MPVIETFENVVFPHRAPNDDGSFMRNIRALINIVDRRSNRDFHVTLSREGGNIVLLRITGVCEVRLNRSQTNNLNRFYVRIPGSNIQAMAEFLNITVNTQGVGLIPVATGIYVNFIEAFGGFDYTCVVDARHFAAAARFMLNIVRSVLYESAPLPVRV